MPVSSVCPYCGVGCGVLLESDGRRLSAVKPMPEHPVSRGMLCVKGATLAQFVNHAERLTQPLMRKSKDAPLKPASWDEALDFVAARLREIKETYGAGSIGVLASAKCTNEENYLLQKFARVAIGTNNVDNDARLCHAPTLYALYESLGSSATTNAFEDLVGAKTVLILGCNPAATFPVLFNRLRKEGKGTITTADVRRSETAEASHEYLRIAHNTDLLLLAGIMKAAISEGLEDKAFIEKNTRGFDSFQKSLQDIEMTGIASVTGIPEIKTTELAHRFAQGSAAVIYGMGVTQQPNAVETVLAIADLMLLTGNVGKANSGIFPLRGCNNVQGTCDVGCLPNVYPGYASMVEETVHRFEQAWGVRELPIGTGRTSVEMIDSIPAKILAMLITGENPMLSHPDANVIAEKLAKLQLLVVQDVFMSETAALADVVLPAACFAEKDGTFTNAERRVQWIRKACEAPGGAKTETFTIQELAKRMGFGRFFAHASAAEVFEEMRGTMPNYAGLAQRDGGMLWPAGRSVLYESGLKAVFYPLAPPKPEACNAYQFMLISHRVLEHYNTGTVSRRVETLSKIMPEARLAMNEADAKRMGIADGETVRVSSDCGSVEVRVRLNQSVPQGTVSLPYHFAEANVNKLTGVVLDPVSRTPAYKCCNVRIEKMGNASEHSAETMGVSD
jgi:formate dehydrogenase alpha subunit